MSLLVNFSRSCRQYQECINRPILCTLFLNHLNRLYSEGIESDHYKTLEVSRNAELNDIKKSYFRLVKLYHPDSNPHNIDEAKEKFQSITEAYNILSDPEKRRQYDEEMLAEMERKSTEHSGSWAMHKGIQINPENVYRKIFGDVPYDKNVIESRQTYAPNIEYQEPTGCIPVWLTFEEAASGGEKKAPISSEGVCNRCFGRGTNYGYKPKQCPFCDENGYELYQERKILCRACQGTKVYIRYPCIECEGKGRILHWRTAYFEYPYGVEDNDVIELALERLGEPDQIVKIWFKVEPSEKFRKDGMDLHSEQTISLSQAVLGGSVKIEGLYENFEVNIPAGTSSHSMICCKSKGWRKDGRVGDHYIHIKITVPNKLTARQRQIIGSFAETEEELNGTIEGILKTTDRKTFVNLRKDADDVSFIKKLRSMLHFGNKT